jgi:hypothetical protein
MIWIARYTKIDAEGQVLEDKIGNFSGGNSKDIIEKVCHEKGLHLPKGCKGSKCEFKTPIPKNPKILENHIIEVSPLGGLIDLQSGGSHVTKCSTGRPA